MVPSVPAPSPGPSLLLPITPTQESGLTNSTRDDAPTTPTAIPRAYATWKHSTASKCEEVGKPQEGSWRALASCLQLCDNMLQQLQQDVLHVERTSVSQASEFATQSTVGLMLSQTVIDNMVIGGPAYNSGQLSKGDELVAIDGQDVRSRLNKHRYDHLASLLKGSDLPGTVVILTVKKLGSGEIKEVTLRRMATELIADRRKLFEKFTGLKDRAIVDKDTVVRDIVDEVIDLWSKMVQAEAIHESKVNQNVVNLLDTLRTNIKAMKSKIPAVHSLVVKAQEHEQMHLRVEELENALRRSCQKCCLQELECEALSSKVSQLQEVASKANALAAIKQEQDFQVRRISEELNTANVHFSADQAAYRALQHEHRMLLSVHADMQQEISRAYTELDENLAKAHEIKLQNSRQVRHLQQKLSEEQAEKLSFFIAGEKKRQAAAERQRDLSQYICNRVIRSQLTWYFRDFRHGVSISKDLRARCGRVEDRRRKGIICANFQSWIDFIDVLRFKTAADLEENVKVEMVSSFNLLQKEVVEERRHLVSFIDRIAKRAALERQKRAIRHSWEGWLVLHDKLVLLKQLLKRNMLRWRRRVLSANLQCLLEACKTSKLLANKNAKFGCKWKLMKYLRFFHRWECRVHCKKMVKWGAKVLNRKTIHSVLCAWQKIVNEESRARMVGAKAHSRWQNRTTARVWVAWLDNYVQCAHATMLKERILQRGMSASLLQVLAEWRHVIYLRSMLRKKAEKTVQRHQSIKMSSSMSTLKEHALKLQGTRRICAYLRIRCQRLTLSRATFGWSECAERQRVLSLAAEEIERRRIYVELKPVTRTWMEYACLRRHLLRAKAEISLRWRKMRMISALERWEHWWYEQKDLLEQQHRSFEDSRKRFQAAEVEAQLDSVMLSLEDEKRRCSSLLRRGMLWMIKCYTASAFRAFLECIRRSKSETRHALSKWNRHCGLLETSQRQPLKMLLKTWQKYVVHVMKTESAATFEEKTIAMREIEKWKGLTLARRLCLEKIMHRCQLLGSFRQFELAVHVAKLHRQFEAVDVQHETAVTQLSHDFHIQIALARKVTEDEKRKRLTVVTQILRRWQILSLQAAFTMFTEAALRCHQYRQTAAKIIESRGGFSTMDPLHVSFQRWIQFTRFQRIDCYKRQVRGAEADVRAAEEEISILVAQNKELDEKLTIIAHDFDRLEFQRQDLAASLARSHEDIEAAHTQIRIQGLEILALEQHRGKASLIVGMRAQAVMLMVHRVDRQMLKSALLHWRLRSDLVRDRMIWAAAEDVRLISTSFLAPSDAPSEEDAITRLPKYPELKRYFVQKHMPVTDLATSESIVDNHNYLRVPQLLATSLRPHMGLSLAPRSHDVQIIGGMSEEAQNVNPRFPDFERARAEVRAVVAAMGRDGMPEDTMSVSMSETELARGQLDRERRSASESVVRGTIAMNGSVTTASDGSPSRANEQENGAALPQSPMHWTSKFKFFNPGHRVWPPTPSPQRAPPTRREKIFISAEPHAGAKAGEGLRKGGRESAAISISQSSPINVAAMNVSVDAQPSVR